MQTSMLLAIVAALQGLASAAPAPGALAAPDHYDFEICKGSDYEDCRHVTGPWNRCTNLRDVAADYNDAISSLAVYGPGKCTAWVDADCKHKKVTFTSNHNLAQNCGHGGCMDNRISSYECNL